MNKDKKLKLGQEILIFNSKNKDVLKPYVKGTVTDCKEVSGTILIYHDWTMDVYTVLGEDGNTYVGTYQENPVMSFYFITRKEYLDNLKSIKNKFDGIDERIAIETETLKQEREAKRRVKSEICKANGHDYGEWEERYYEEPIELEDDFEEDGVESSLVVTKWSRKCKCCGCRQTVSKKPIEVTMKELEERGKVKRK